MSAETIATDLGLPDRHRGLPLRLHGWLRSRRRHPVPLDPGREDRDLAVNTVAPVWDGNETWLILGGGGLFAVFPLAYATIMPALYMPIIVMLLALIFRGVAFEMRFRAATPGQLLAGTGPSPAAAMWRRSARGWRSAPSCRGSRSMGRAYAGGWWDWLTPFSVLTGGGAGGRLRAARRLLAGLEDRGRPAGAGGRAGAAAGMADPGVHRAGEPGHALPAAGLPRPLVRLPRHPGGAAGAGAGGAAGLAHVPRAAGDGRPSLAADGIPFCVRSGCSSWPIPGLASRCGR